MNKEFSQEELRVFSARLKAMIVLLNSMARDIDAKIMKETTQRSPEFFGQANC